MNVLDGHIEKWGNSTSLGGDLVVMWRVNFYGQTSLPIDTMRRTNETANGRDDDAIAESFRGLR